MHFDVSPRLYGASANQDFVPFVGSNGLPSCLISLW
jgi:hypothetical protein